MLSPLDIHVTLIRIFQKITKIWTEHNYQKQPTVTLIFGLLTCAIHVILTSDIFRSSYVQTAATPYNTILAILK